MILNNILKRNLDFSRAVDELCIKMNLTKGVEFEKDDMIICPVIFNNSTTRITGNIIGDVEEIRCYLIVDILLPVKDNVNCIVGHWNKNWHLKC